MDGKGSGGGGGGFEIDPALKAQAKELGFDFECNINDDELEDDMEEVNEEAELDELEEASAEEKLSFLQTRFGELKHQAETLRANNASDAAVGIVKERAMTVQRLMAPLRGGKNPALKQMPQVPSVEFCLKKAGASGARAQGRGGGGGGGGAKGNAGKGDSSQDAATAQLTKTQAAIAASQKLLESDDFDDDDFDEDTDEDMDVEAELAKDPDTLRAEQEEKRLQHKQQLLQKQAEQQQQGGVDVAVTDNDAGEATSGVNTSTHSDTEAERRKKSPGVGRQLRRSLSPLSHSSPAPKLDNSGNDGSGHVALVETTTLKMQYEAAVKKHYAAGNTEYSHHCKKMLSVLMDIETHIREGKAFSVDKLPPPPDKVRDANTKAFDTLETTLRSQKEECLNLAQEYHKQGKLEHEKRLKQFADLFQRDVSAVVSMRARGQQVPPTEHRTFSFPVERLHLDVREDELAVEVRRGIALKVPRGGGKDYTMSIKSTLTYPKDHVQEKHSKEHVPCEQHPTFNNTRFKLRIERDRRFKSFTSRGYVLLTVTAKKRGLASWFANEVELCECKVPLKKLLTSSEVHECFPCGRSSNAKLEVVLRLQSPLEGRDVTKKEYTWTMLDRGASKAATIASAVEDRVDKVDSILRRKSPSSKTAASGGGSSPSSSSSLQYAAYLSPKNLTSHDVLRIRLKAYQEKIAPHKRQLDRGQAPQQVQALYAEMRTGLQKLRVAREIVSAGGGPKLQQYLTQVLRERDNYRKLQQLCKEDNPELAKKALICWKTATAEIEGARKRFPKDMAAAEEAAKTAATTTTRSASSSTASSPSKQQQQQQTPSPSSTPERPQQQQPGAGTATGAKPSASAADVVPKVSNISSTMALNFLFSELNEQLQPHAAELAQQTADKHVLKLAEERASVMRRIRALQASAQEAMNDPPTLKQHVSQHLERATKDRDAFLRAYAHFKKTGNGAMMNRYEKMATAAAQEVEDTKAGLEQLSSS